MANYSTNEFRSGLKIIIDNDPCIIVENEFVKPGKGQAFNRVRIKNLKTGKTVDKTFKSGESVEAADVIDTEMQFLYTDGEFWHFMLPDTFEQYAADAAAAIEIDYEPLPVITDIEAALAQAELDDHEDPPLPEGVSVVALTTARDIRQ